MVPEPGFHSRTPAHAAAVDHTGHGYVGARSDHRRGGQIPTTTYGGGYYATNGSQDNGTVGFLRTLGAIADMIRICDFFSGSSRGHRKNGEYLIATCLSIAVLGVIIKSPVTVAVSLIGAFIFAAGK